MIYRRFASIALLAVFQLLTANGVFAQTPPNPSICDVRLGTDYDQQAGPEKSARLKQYFNCRYLQDFEYLRARHLNFQGEVYQWKARAVRVTGDSLYTKMQAAIAELNAAHQAEQAEYQAKFQAQFAALGAAQSTSNPEEHLRKVRELNDQRNAEGAEMNLRQAEESRMQTETLQSCQAKVTSDIEAMIASDIASVANQFQDKLDWLRSEYDALAQTPIGGSLNDAAEPIGAVQDAQGDVTVTRPDGESIQGGPGTPIYQGDTVATGSDSRCRIIFADETSVDLSQGGKLTIDEYVYDPDAGPPPEPSWFRKLFKFTSGLIERNEPEDVEIDFQRYGGTGFRG